MSAPALVPDPFLSRLRREPIGPGALEGTTFAIKDVFSVAGEASGFGSPDWARTHVAAERTCPVVEALLAAGATLVGRTHLEELAFSLTGENAHYGTPLNPAAPDRIPGGSSSGSAAAVAAGLVDFALGTDTGGSIRVPASFCGIAGIRPSHGRVSTEGVLALARSFDTVGWLARDARLLARVGSVLLDAGSGQELTRLLVADDALALGEEPVRAVLEKVLEGFSERYQITRVCLCPEGLSRWADAFRVLQGREAWQEHGRWIEETKPTLGPSVRGRFEYARSVTEAQVRDAAQVREAATERLAALLSGGAVLFLPTAPGPPPLRGRAEKETEEYRWRAMQLTSPAGLARLPQVSLPAGLVQGAPLGYSLMAAQGLDAELLHCALKSAG